jgi:hypothetical protein
LGIIALTLLIVAGLIFANPNRGASVVDVTPTSSIPTRTPVPTFGRLSFLSTNSTADTVSLVAQGLTPQSSGHIYVAWLVNPETDGTIRLGQLNLDPLGNGSLSFTDIQRRTLVATFNRIIITSESELGSAPAGEVVYSGTISNEIMAAFTEIFLLSPNGFEPSSVPGLEGYTPSVVTNAGLLAGAISEGEIALQHTGLASEATTLGGLYLHAEHTINALRGEQVDHDADGRGENPGRGTGVYRFLDLIAEQLTIAGNGPGVSLTIQRDIERVRVCLDNARVLAGQVIELETLLLNAADLPSIEEQKTASTVLADRMVNGYDQDGNGQIEALEGECGLRQIETFGILMSSIELQEGALLDAE